MAILRSLIVITLLLLVSITGIRCNNADLAANEREIKELKSKIASLESTCLDQEKEIKEKGKKQSYLESNIHDNSAKIASLSSEIDLLQKNGNSDDDELISKGNAHHYMLQKQIEMLESELESQIQKREALETKANEAEKTAQKLSQKLEYIEKINDGQRQKIEEINRDFKHAQDELSLAKAKANSQAKKLQQLHGAWLPHWLTNHIDPLKNKIIYAIREYTELIRRHMEPHMQIASSKTSDVYEICVDALTPHYVKVKQSFESYLHEIKRFMSPHYIKMKQGFQSYLHEMKRLFQPYIVQVKTASKPYSTKVHLIYAPYKKRVVAPIKMYHHKVQTAIYESLKKHEILRPLATQNIALIMASALFCAPLIFIYTLGSSMLGKRRKRNRGGDHVTRKHKRRHTEK